MKFIVAALLVGMVKSFSPSPTFIIGTGNSNLFQIKVLMHNQNHKNREQILLHQSPNSNEDKSSIDVMMGKIDIPDEYMEEIFRAEANTPAAKDRETRVAIFVSVALLGIAVSSFNAFLTNLREGGGTDLTTINELGFSWVSGNPLFSFLFLNKIGGGLALLSAGLGGTMFELEQRTKNDNAEKIWAELQRRKSEAEGGKKKKKKKQSKGSSSKKKMSKKNRKRLDALSEVMMEKEEIEPTEPVATESTTNNTVTSEEKEETGILGKVKDFYQKADSMAQSQALMMNKELEDRGVVEKITDETGLKVIGKEAAAKLQNKDETDNDSESNKNK